MTLKNASAIDLVPLLNRLVGAEAATQGGAPGDAQQRVMIVADPRSNSVLLRSDNPGRAARIKTMIEQLDTPQRAGGNMFIVYLRNADAARVAQTLRALLSGGADIVPAVSDAHAVHVRQPVGDRARVPTRAARPRRPRRLRIRSPAVPAAAAATPAT